MNITLNIPDELGEQLQALPNLDKFAIDLFQKAISQKNDRPLTDFEKQFTLDSLESAKAGDYYTEAEMREFYKSKGVDIDGD
ncbi:MAG: hypothetical protein HQL54_12550 [Magnetococcales bacterium]|nr:hypothetical protein [Magnetococcales bacterium]